MSRVGDTRNIPSYFKVSVPNKEGEKKQVRVHKQGGLISYLAICILQGRFLSLNEYRGIIAEGGLNRLIDEDNNPNGLKKEVLRGKISELNRVDPLIITNLYDRSLKRTSSIVTDLYRELFNESDLAPVSINKETELKKLLNSELSGESLKTQIAILTHFELYQDLISKEDVHQAIKKTIAALSEKAISEIKNNKDFKNSDSYKTWEQTERMINNNLEINYNVEIMDQIYESSNAVQEALDDAFVEETMVKVNEWRSEQQKKLDAVLDHIRKGSPLTNDAFRQAIVGLREIMQVENVPEISYEVFKLMTDEERSQIPDAIFNHLEKNGEGTLGILQQVDRHDLANNNFIDVGKKNKDLLDNYNKQNSIINEGFEEIRLGYKVDLDQRIANLPVEEFEKFANMDSRLYDLEESRASLPQKIATKEQEVARLQKLNAQLEKKIKSSEEELNVAEKLLDRENNKLSRAVKFRQKAEEVIKGNRDAIATLAKDPKSNAALIEKGKKIIAANISKVEEVKVSIENSKALVKNAKDLVKSKQDAVRNIVIELSDVKEKLKKEEVSLKGLKSDESNSLELQNRIQEAQKSKVELRGQLETQLRSQIRNPVRDIVDARVEHDLREYARGNNNVPKAFDGYIREGKVEELVEEYTDLIFKSLDQGDELNYILNLKEAVADAVRAKIENHSHK